MLPTIKMYKIDYEFLISNYLNPSLWKKSWNLFVYKDVIFTLSLSSIDCKDRSICFKISCNKNNSYDWESVWYYLDNTTIPVLKKQINGAIFNLMLNGERHKIYLTEGYKEIKSLQYEEESRLRAIAEDYLINNGVTNKDICEPYIDKFISDNTKLDDMLNDYVESMKYTLDTEIMLLFTEITNDKSRKDTIVNKMNNPILLEIIKESLKEFKEEFDDEETYINTLEDYLEAI